MFRLLLAGLLAAGVVSIAVLLGRTAPEKKLDLPKKKERIAIADPAEAAEAAQKIRTSASRVSTSVRSHSTRASARSALR